MSDIGIIPVDFELSGGFETGRDARLALLGCDPDDLARGESCG
jgi:hypothetical protein